MTDTEIEHELEVFFAAEKLADNVPGGALLDAVLRDAETLQPDPVGLVQARKPTRWSFRRDIWHALGGWQAAAALSLSLVVGGVIGYTPPEGLSDLAQSVFDTTEANLTGSDYFSLDDLMAEG